MYFNDVVVYCDEPADQKLFISFQEIAPILKNIPRTNIKVYPQAPSAIKISEYNNLISLFKYDRPDLIFARNGIPLLVVELTEHAYTGDNGLQRFVRVASAAENSVPFIYFGPLARVRDDELDKAEDVSKLSKRSLTSDFFEGMAALHKHYGSYQLYSEWATASNGKVIKTTLSNRDDFTSVYKHLCDLIVAILDSNHSGNKSKYHELLQNNQAELLRLSGVKNTKFSDVKFELSSAEAKQIILNPHIVLSRMGDYFHKGKPDKLLALYALRTSNFKHVYIMGKTYKFNPIKDTMLDKLFLLKQMNNKSLCYFSGYKWRSDPHCGVAVNLFARYCLPSKSFKPLILFYPRVSISNEKSAQLIKETKEAAFIQLFKDRYGKDFKEKLVQTTSSSDLYHSWVASTKQGRIFSHYCSIIVCNDGIIIGDKLGELL
ncbi:hypothetical protein [Geobacter sp. AOG1]|uniref:hypothetical protein n=1 Tax=Geobacter sp. AOG1 TaxID=1566346 RepID=UPI001CC76DAC|nr:hypothetical protein [Geobacter sp. AOG1]GFE57406.1 hypothetical protein AOG1_12860 [Geobacter sp. AOG1]